MHKNYIFSKKKNVILYIYKYKCKVCGIFNACNHVHHLDRNHANNDAFNLIVLCKICHRFTHKHHVIIAATYTPTETASLNSLNSFL